MIDSDISVLFSIIIVRKALAVSVCLLNRVTPSISSLYRVYRLHLPVRFLVGFLGDVFLI